MNERGHRAPTACARGPSDFTRPHRRPDGWREARTQPPETAQSGASVEVLGGAVTLGNRDGDASFGRDNEHGSLEVTVPDLEVRAHLVTNLEYEHFVQSDGYEREEIREPDGWAWVRSEGVQHPRFWCAGPGSTSLRTVFDERSLPPD